MGPTYATAIQVTNGDNDPYARARRQTGRANRHDAVIESAGFPNGGFFDQPENHENQQRSSSVAHR
jgi:hypothetical protein